MKRIRYSILTVAGIRRLRGVLLTFLVAILTGAGGAAYAQDAGEESTTGLKIALVIEHDLGVILGMIPEPITQYGGETVELATNLALKYIPPDVAAPASRAIDPLDAPPAGAMFTADGCGIDFELLSPNAGFENMLGFINFRDPYLDSRTNTEYLFRDRWGFLGEPYVWHANSSVGLSVGSLGSTRRYDALSGGLSDWYVPIDSNTEDPQTVHLPIGQHGVVWSAATEINYLGDIAFPSALLVVGVLTEVKWGSAGVDAAQKVKKSGVGNTAPDPQSASRMRRAGDRFTAFVKRTLKKMTGTDPDDTTPVADAIKDEVKCFFGDVLISTLGGVRDLGLDAYSQQDIEDLRDAGLITRAEEVMLNAVRLTSPIGDVSIAVALALADCNDPDETIFEVLSIVLDTADFDFMEVFTDYTQLANAVQSITIWDSVPPTIVVDPGPVVFEATDFGGTRFSRVRNDLFAMAETGASDNCGRLPIVSVDAPDLLPIGDTVVTWRAQDSGPNPDDGQDYSPTATQTIRVEDTQPPLLLAPPSRVFESNTMLSNPAIGDAVAVDLADVQPVIVNDAPAGFPVNERVPVTWTATDASGNASTASQLITVKTLGSNNAPSANAATAQTLTAEPVDIRLSASDPDVLGDRADPLWFKIESQPQHGEFVAPLFPFFIEDYRTRPNDGLGDAFDPEVHNLRSFMQSNYCDTDLPSNERVPPQNFVHDARYVHVTDEGTRFVLDHFWASKQFDDNPDTLARFSKWSAAGDFLGQVRIGADESERPEGDSFVLDRDGYLYYLVDTDTGSSNQISLNRCATDWDGLSGANTSTQCTDSYKFDSSSAPGSLIDAGSLRYVRFDSVNSVAYVADQFSVFAFELLDSGATSFLGELGPRDENDEVVDDWVGEPQALEVGADGSLYVADIGDHRIHKIAAIGQDDDGQRVPGDYIGWSGRCTTSGNKACDVDRQRSRGYSCTFAADSCTVEPANRSGPAQGQFDTPRFITLDPNDVLYVADYGNERIQRLSPDGSFAGEAVSDGSGINKGDRPSFVLGNMGAPASVSVNSSQFFIVDRAEQFVHVFGTLPFKDIADDAATVTYVPDQAFPNPNVTGTDAFTFSVSDGLATSAPATATITVNRNYRPPTALAAEFSTNEDTALELTLPADDPDGIAGKDFLGLDTLTYTITEPPQHGELAGQDDNWTYTPDPDYFGADSFNFIVNDGYDDSQEATVTLEIVPVNDPPEVTVHRAQRVGRGFPTVIRADFVDDPAESYEGNVVWGDGSSDVTGGIVNPDDENPYIDGVVITAPPPGQVTGLAVAQHTYETTGPKTVEACLTDADGETACASAVLLVEELASIGLQARVLDPANPLLDDEFSRLAVFGGTAFTYEVMVTNGIPYVGSGIAANAVSFDAELPQDITIQTVTANGVACAVEMNAMHCDLGTLAPGDTALIEVDVIGPLDPGATVSRALAGVVATTSPAIEPMVEFEIVVDIESATTDSDGDGMPDGWEVANGFDPADASDGAGDADADGLSNADEYAQGKDPFADDVAPVIAVPPAVTVTATGRMTPVDLGEATAADGAEGNVAATPDTAGPWRTGVHVVTWTAADSLGNTAYAEQQIRITPLANFAVDQAVVEGETAIVAVELNGPAAQYPVTIPYSIAGSASHPDDHHATDGEIVISGGLTGALEIEIVADALVEPDESLEIVMGTPVNAARGTETTHSIRITESNLAPRVSIVMQQQGLPVTMAARDAGAVTVTALVKDAPGEVHSFDWSGGDPATFDAGDVNLPAYDFDPAGLAPGVYVLKVAVTDDGAPAAASTASTRVKIVDALPPLGAADDSDGDGLNDLAEGYSDADGDRIPAYLDAYETPTVLPLSGENRWLETITGLRLRAGPSAFAAATGTASLAEADVLRDPDFAYPEGLADFEITGVAPGGAAVVVMPLGAGIAAEAVYRKLAAGAWFDFSELNADLVESAEGANGACPPPQAAAYTSPISAGHGCLQLTLTDGGRNDADGVADGVISDPGGLGVPMRVDVEAIGVDDQAVDDDGVYVVVRFRLHSASADVQLRSLTLSASGNGDDTSIDEVALVHDLDGDGLPGDSDPILGSGVFDTDNGELVLQLSEPIELPVGTMDVLVTYGFGATVD